MRPIPLISFLIWANACTSLPTSNPTDSEREQIYQAHGAVPDAPAPQLQSDDITSFKLLALNELFEVFFFTELLYNITNNVQGYEIADEYDRNSTIQAITAIRSQEEVHALLVNAVLVSNGYDAIQPCEYNAPVTDLQSAVNLAITFTDLVVGVFQNVVTLLARNNDTAGIGTTVAVVGNEAQQVGYFRHFNNKTPTSTPTLTGSLRSLTYSALLQLFIVPNSCPNSNEIDPIIYPALTVLQPPDPNSNQTQTVSFSVPESAVTYLDNNNYQIVYVTQQDSPTSVPITITGVNNGDISFTAPFPPELVQYGGYGLYLFVLTNSTGPFQILEDVFPYIVAGPYLYDVK